MEDYRVTQTGDEIQEIFNQSPIDTADIAGLKEADALLDGRLEVVEGKIPAGASAENPLTDKQYVDDSIASASATFGGTYNEVEDLELTTAATHAEIAAALADTIYVADNNDYCFVQIPTSDATPTEIGSIERYKFVTGTGWEYEYTLNNSGFTAEQWEAINSGITSGLVTKLTELPTNAELTTLLNGKANAAEVYTKSETYNKTELDSMITTPDVQYVSVTATAQTTSVTDVLPATGAADTVYRVGSWDGTQYDANSYSEYAWDGTAYVLLNVKDTGIATGNDFDNPTAAQRELLTTVGAVLDGCDAVPTPASVKPVQSGGVSKVQFYNFFTGKGNTFASTTIDCLIPGVTYRVYLRNTAWDIPSGATGYKFQISSFNPSQVNLISVGASDTCNPYYDFTVPADSEYITVGGRATNGVKVLFYIVEISSAYKLDEIRQTAMYDTLPVEDVPTSLAAASISTTVDTSVKNCLCDKNFYAISPSSTVFIKCADDIKVRIVEYNESKTYIRYSTYAFMTRFVVGSTTKYIRICADYTARGYSSSNPVTVDDYQDGDFGLYYKTLRIDSDIADTEPIDGSPKLITSGAVKIQINTILNGHEANYINNALYNSAGELKESNGWGAFKEKIPCNAGNTVVWNPQKIDTSACIVFFNANNEKVADRSANATSRTITVPANTSYLRCCFSKVDGANNYNAHPLYVNGVEYKRVDYIASLNTLDERVDLLENRDSRRLTYEKGFYDSNGNKSSQNVLDNSADAGWLLSETYIPVIPGDSIVWNFGKNQGSTYKCLISYNSSRELVSYATANSDSGTRTITIASGVAFIRVSWFKTFNGQDNTVPVTVNGVPYFIDNIAVNIYHDNILFPSNTTHGTIGESYPEEIVEIGKYLTHAKNANYHRFQFLHISDNHNNSFGYAEDYLDYSPAKFLINTGDLVNDKFTDGASNTIAKSIAPDKPVYLVLGNHDYSHATSNQAVFNLFYGDDETEGTVNYHNAQAGGVAVDKTYYSIDFATEKVKCIMLDMNDGWSDSELPSLGPSSPGATSGKMSQTQINWFVSELQSAKTKNYHVCVFIHTLPYNVDTDKRISDFCDVLNNSGLGVNSSLTFLPSIIDGFINGGNVAFDYNGNSYNFTFAAGGHFVSWICGHTHYDMAGWMQGHTDQFMINVCRPFPDTAAYLGTYDGDKLGVHFNFITVDTNVKSLSVYRVGQQKTVFATDRKSFRIIYK